MTVFFFLNKCLRKARGFVPCLCHTHLGFPLAVLWKDCLGGGNPTSTCVSKLYVYIVSWGCYEKKALRTVYLDLINVVAVARFSF